MRVLVTGAGGFLGRYVVAEAVRRGHDVCAMLRPSASHVPFPQHPRLTYAYADLRKRDGLPDAVEGQDAVIHLAASSAGDFYTQFEGSVLATENLMEALKAEGACRIVHISSFSVYGYRQRWSFARLDESSPIDKYMDDRDDYAKTKWLQEELVRRYAMQHDWSFVILRPGVIYGPDRLFSARLGGKISNHLWARIGAWAPVPLTYVENCAEAIVLAAERTNVSGETLNIVDSKPPSQRAYVAKLRRRAKPRPRVVPIPWTAVRAVAGLAWAYNKIMLGRRARLPGILIPARVHARFKPSRYPNRRIRETLSWEPRYTLDESLDRAFTHVPLDFGSVEMEPAKEVTS